MDISTTNSITENTILNSKFVNLDYLFNNGIEIFKYIFNAKTVDGFFVFLSFLAIFFMAVIIYVTIRMFEIRAKEHAYLHHEIAEFAHSQKLKQESTEKVGSKNERWIKVLDYLFSTNENDWKLAIIEADSMLFDLLGKTGIKGESLGDKLKEAGNMNFQSINSAWEVHNIRNKIAHEGSSFEISLHEAKRVISLYELIFKEFGYI